MQNISDHHLFHAICGSFLDGEKGSTLFLKKKIDKKACSKFGYLFKLETISDNSDCNNY